MEVYISVIRPLSPSTGIVNGAVQPSNILLQPAANVHIFREHTANDWNADSGMLSTLSLLTDKRLPCQKHKTWRETVFKLTVVKMRWTEN